MKNFTSKLLSGLLLLPGLLGTYSCSGERTEEVLPSPETRSTRSSVSQRRVTAETAGQIALRFAQKMQVEKERLEQTQLDGIYPLPDSEGNTILYAVNIKGGGYVLVAADLIMRPIAGYTTRGKYNPLTLLPQSLDMTISDFTVRLQEARLNPDASEEKNRIFWMPYADLFGPQKVAVDQYTDHGYRIIGDAIYEWTNQGWSYCTAQYWIQEKVHMPHLLRWRRNG